MNDSSISPVVLPAALRDAGERCGELLIERNETVTVAEGSCGGLIATALLAVPGASAYFRGGAVIYTQWALKGMLSGIVEPPQDLQGASEPWALHLARAARAHVRTHWAIGEGGAAGPSGNRYGNPAGYAWVAVVGGETRPVGEAASADAAVEVTENVETGQSDRLTNMTAFAVAGLQLLAATLEARSQGDGE